MSILRLAIPLTALAAAAVAAAPSARAASLEVLQDDRILTVLGTTTDGGPRFDDAVTPAAAGGAFDEVLSRDAASPTASYLVAATALQASQFTFASDSSFVISVDLSTSASRLVDPDIDPSEFGDPFQGNADAEAVFDVTLLFDGTVSWEIDATGTASEGLSSIEYFGLSNILSSSGSGTGTLSDAGTSPAGSYRIFGRTVESVVLGFPDSDTPSGDLSFTITGSVASVGGPNVIPTPAAAWAGLTLLGGLLLRRHPSHR